METDKHTAAGVLTYFENHAKAWGTPLRRFFASPSYVRALAIILVALLTYLIHQMLFSEIDTDEVEHTHITWLLSEGVMPYRDIHEIHLPVVWILYSPFVSVLKPSVFVFLLARALCFTAFTLACALGSRLVSKLVSAERRPVAILFFLLLAFTFTIKFETFRYRADPLMTLCAMAGIFALSFLQIYPRRAAFLSGLLLGTGVTFSVKMIPLTLLLPVLWLASLMKRAKGEPLSLALILPYVVGGILPAAGLYGWLASHELVGDFWKWVVVNNSNMLSPEEFSIRVKIKVCLGVAFVAASVWFILRDRKFGGDVLTKKIVAAACALAMASFLLRPTLSNYNLQTFIVPFAVLATLFVATKIRSFVTFARFSVAAGIAFLAVAMLTPPPGVTIPQTSLAKLIREGAKSETCVGFAPYHATFCRDSVEMFNMWNLWYLEVGFVTPAGREPYREMWKRSIASLSTQPPRLIVRPSTFEEAYYRVKALTDNEIAAIRKVFAERYESVSLGGVPALLLKP